MCIHCKSHICKSLWIKASAKWLNVNVMHCYCEFTISTGWHGNLCCWQVLVATLSSALKQIHGQGGNEQIALNTCFQMPSPIQSQLCTDVERVQPVPVHHADNKERLSCNPYWPLLASSANLYHGFVSLSDASASSHPCVRALGRSVYIIIMHLLTLHQEGGRKELFTQGTPPSHRSRYYLIRLISNLLSQVVSLFLQG